MKIGDEVYIHGYIDEIRKDVIIIKNEGGYFGTVREEIYPSVQPKPIECEDAVSRQAVLKEFEKGTENLYGRIDKLPSVRPQEQIGHWIMSDDGLYRPICDKCGAHPWKGYIPTVEEATEMFKYCPNCGKRMIEPTCETCEYNTAAFMPCNSCDDKSEYDPQERGNKE